MLIVNFPAVYYSYHGYWHPVGVVMSNGLGLDLWPRDHWFDSH